MEFIFMDEKMLSLITQIFLALLLINMVILTHELGHYWAAMSVGIPREVLAIGFGPTLLKKTLPSGSTIELKLLPFGGYVKLKQIAMQQSPYKRLWVLIAGPLSNLICAVITLTFLLSHGLLENKTLIGNIVANTPANIAKMQPRELITTIDAKPVQTWHEVLYHTLLHLDHQHPMTIQTMSLSGHKTANYQLQFKHWRLDPEQLNIFKSIGFDPYKPHINTVINKLDPNGPAAKAGLKPQDKIIAINQQPLSSWLALLDFLKSHANQTVNVTFIRNQQQLTLPVQLSSKLSSHWHKVGYLGAGPYPAHWPKFAKDFTKLPLAQSIQTAIDRIVLHTKLVAQSIKMLINGSLPLTALSGPLGIANLTIQSVSSGFKVALKTFVLLSVMIGVANLLPLPGLDGGQILYTGIELIRKRPISDRWQALTAQLTFIVMIVLVAHLTIRDVGKMISDPIKRPPTKQHAMQWLPLKPSLTVV